jgi:hypothetical protein
LLVLHIGDLNFVRVECDRAVSDVLHKFFELQPLDLGGTSKE